jgi:hypothetical protein
MSMDDKFKEIKEKLKLDSLNLSQAKKAKAYEILGLVPPVSEKDIEAAYTRKKASLNLEQRLSGGEAEIEWAYEMLSTPGSKRGVNSDQSRYEDIPAIWNPNATCFWGWIFTPIFGSYLQAKNWRALGEEERAKISMKWFYANLCMLVTYIFMGLFTPEDKADSVALGLALFYFIAWYFFSGKKQKKYVKEKFGPHYPRRSWGKPLSIGFAILLPIVFLNAVLSIAFEGEEQRQRTASIIAEASKIEADTVDSVGSGQPRLGGPVDYDPLAEKRLDDPRERCRVSAASYFERKYGKEGATQYKNHYNKKVDRCFILTASVELDGNGQVAKQVRLLYDVQENDEYARLHQTYGKITDCAVGAEGCKSEQEWFSLIQPYMTE